jgi:hypothetical protein
MLYKDKYLKYKSKYLELKKQVGGNKFKLGDMVKRIGSSYNEGSKVEALGMIGEIKNINESSEWPPQSGKMIPKMYFINFPDLYKGTKHEGVLLGVVEDDLELVPPQDAAALAPAHDKFKSGDRFYLKSSLDGVENPTGTILHKRTQYGPFKEGTYMVKFDDPTIKEHNVYGDDMVGIVDDLELVSPHGTAALAPPMGHKASQSAAALPRPMRHEPQDAAALAPAHDKFKSDDRFYLNSSLNGVKNPTGTVKYRRTMYGDSNGGVYKVQFDNPIIKEHNADGDEMVGIVDDLELVSPHGTAALAPPMGHKASQSAAALPRPMRHEPQDAAALAPAHDKFKSGDRFYLNSSLNGVKNPTGTVKYRRTMYGDSNGGVYKVQFDNPIIKEHNADGDDMVKV